MEFLLGTGEKFPRFGTKIKKIDLDWSKLGEFCPNGSTMTDLYPFPYRLACTY